MSEPTTATSENDLIKAKVKELFEKVAKRDKLMAEVAVINLELAEYGLDIPTATANNAPANYSLQVSDIPKLVEFIGKDKKTYAAIAKKFSGHHINVKKFVAEHADKFTVDKDNLVSAKK